MLENSFVINSNYISDSENLLQKPENQNVGWKTTNDALEEINDNRTSIPEIGKRNGLPESTLRKRRNMLEKGIPLVGSGSKTALTPEQVKQLALRIGELCALRFSPT